ncbi:hypothetical protein E4U49_006020, partial [Claviceps purpurea]
MWTRSKHRSFLQAANAPQSQYSHCGQHQQTYRRVDSVANRPRLAHKTRKGMPPIDNQPHHPKVLQLCISRVLGRQRLTSLDSSVASIGGVQNICPASSQVLGRRFAQHLKFRFVAYNVLARSQANKQSAYFLKKVQRESVTVESEGNGQSEQTRGTQSSKLGQPLCIQY